jgi:Ca-activated chloride channel family protein
MSGQWRVAAVAAGIIFAALAPNQAQVAIEPRSKPAPAESQARSNIRIITNLVLIPVTVCDPMNRPVTGLEKDHFRIFDNKVEQSLSHFSMDDEPLAVGIVFDTSGSMGNKLRRSRMAVAAFFKTANPEDEFFLVQFNDSPKLITPLTSNTEEIQTQLTFTQAKGRTALLDAIGLALHEMKKSKKQRKALLIISDGGDNSSRFTESEIKNMVRENDVIIYAIGIFEPAGSRVRTAEEMSGPGLLSDVAEQTGGRHFPVENLSELPDIAAKIGVELRNRYVLGFAPSDPQRDGRYHKLQVKLVPPRGLPPLRVFWRLGYYAPAE